MYIALPGNQKWDSIDNIHTEDNHTMLSACSTRRAELHKVQLLPPRLFFLKNHAHEPLVISFIKINHAFL